MISVVMLAYGAESYLGEAVAAVLASEGVELELVLVDNGCTTDAVDRLPADPRLRVVVPGTNLGFTGGVNRGVESTTGDVIVLVNSDAVVAPDAAVVEPDLPPARFVRPDDQPPKPGSTAQQPVTTGQAKKPAVNQTGATAKPATGQVKPVTAPAKPAANNSKPEMNREYSPDSVKVDKPLPGTEQWPPR